MSRAEEGKCVLVIGGPYSHQSGVKVVWSDGRESWLPIEVRGLAVMLGKEDVEVAVMLHPDLVECTDVEGDNLRLIVNTGDERYVVTGVRDRDFLTDSDLGDEAS